MRSAVNTTNGMNTKLALNAQGPLYQTQQNARLIRIISSAFDTQIPNISAAVAQGLKLHIFIALFICFENYVSLIGTATAVTQLNIPR